MKQTNPTYLQRQYTKLTQKLQKAYQSGKFYQYTQYKQSQLLDKLASYTLQLKKLGMAAAVVTGVGMATPAAGQILFMENTGTANPLNVDDTLSRCPIDFVDLDADGDLDAVGFYYTYFEYKTIYYENTGTAKNAAYTKRNPLFAVADNVSYPTFVDVDGDGDMDCFAVTMDPYYARGEAITYFENTGTATSPSFTKRTGTANPLDTINLLYPQIAKISRASRGSSFIDIDADGDQDLFYYIREVTATSTSGSTYFFFKNNGTSTSPNFDLDHANNPYQDTISSSSLQGKMQFIDADNDNDLDILLDRYYYENRGSAANPLYDTLVSYWNINSSPFSNISGTRKTDVRLVDIDNDGDLDLFGYDGVSPYYNIYSNTLDTIRFFENLTITALPQLQKQQKINLTISPNPTTGYLQLDRPITGAMEIFNIAGQVVQSAQLNEEQAIDLGDLTNGIYFLKVQTLEGLINEKIVLSK